MDEEASPAEERELCKKGLSLPNPFSVRFDRYHPRYTPGSVIDDIPLLVDCLHIDYVERSNFATPEQGEEYGRDAMVQIIRDWLQPRLNYWARSMEGLAARIPQGVLNIVEYTELVLDTLWNLHLVLEEMMQLFFTEEQRESLAGRAFRMELRARLLPWNTLKSLYAIITQTLECAYNVMRDVCDQTRGRNGAREFPCFPAYKPEDEMVFKLEPNLGVHWELHQDDRRHRFALANEVLLKRIRRLYEDLNSSSSLLWGLSHSPAFAVARRRTINIVDEAVMDVTDKDMYGTITDDLRELKQFLEWFATNFPWTQSDRVTEANPRPGEDDEAEEEDRSPDRKRLDILIDIDELWEKTTIDKLIGKIYAITIEHYPRTRKTVELLRFCLDRQHHYGRELVVNRLIHDVSITLLNVGTSTWAILQAYANAVESLRLLDPSCVIMHRVCKVIKAYIKKRPDTVRQIINYITTEKRNEINLSKQKAATIVVDEDDLAGVNDEFLPGGGGSSAGGDGEDEMRWDRWMPDPPDARPGETCRYRRSADVFNMLVSVYGSKEMFVKEYRQLLAERLGNPATRDPDFERRYLNLLHLRFSDGELQQCEVMLRDVEQSAAVNSKAGKSAPLIRGHVVSSHFWPNVEHEKNIEKMPEGIEEELAAFDEEFSKMKSNRHLNWLRSIGTTDLSLTIDDVRIEKTVPNVMAVVLYAFLEKEEWDVNELAEQLKMTKALAKRRMEWWESQGVLTQYLPAGATSEVFCLTKTPGNMHRFKGNMDGEEDDDEEEEAEDPMDAVESLEQYWKYTKSYIANQDNSEIKPERLLSIYRMFASPSSQQISLDTVVAFLSRKVKLGLLTTSNGLYKVVKDADGNVKG